MSDSRHLLSPSSLKLINHPLALCNQVKRVAVKAGDVIMDYFDDTGMVGSDLVDDKSDGSPVTQADRSAEALIEKGLFDITPDIPIIGEEAAEAGKLPNITDHDYFWCVDPLDGTKEFISGSGDFTVNIALIYQGQPFLGVVYAPYTGELFGGVVGHKESDRQASLLREDLIHGRETDDRPIQVRKPPAKGLTVMTSKSHGNNQRLDQFLDQFKIAKLVKRGSSLKMCQIAAGKADIYPRFGPTCEWDTAAAHAILRAAGGDILDLDHNPLTYGHAARKFLNPEFIAINDTTMLTNTTSDEAE